MQEAITCYILFHADGLVWFKVFNATFNNISLAPLSIIYQLVVSFIGGGNRSTRRKPLTRCKSRTKFHHIMFRVHLTTSGILTLVVNTYRQIIPENIHNSLGDA